jgi:hypothetical protein
MSAVLNNGSEENNVHWIWLSVLYD